MEMLLLGFFLFWLLFIAADISVHGQLQTGFISIDCGSSRESYNDDDVNINYRADGPYIDTGTNGNISSEYAYPNNPTLPYPLSDVRSFPQGNKNCYTLVPEVDEGGLILIRATFLYGNYDGEDKLPEFDLYLDFNFWTSVKFKNASDVFTTEIVTTARPNATYVCLFDKGLGTPFISALELRPLLGSKYGSQVASNASLVLIERLDIGLSNGTGRYRDDSYDRIWNSSYMAPSWDPISTSSPIEIFEDGNRLPFEVISTAARPRNASGSLELQWSTSDPNSQFYVYVYFAELERLQRNQSRKLNVSWNGTPFLGPFIPSYLYASTLSNSIAFVGTEHRVSIYRTEDSILPPILNAFEVYLVRRMDTLSTYSGDVDAIMTIKSTYRVNKYWTGDPCKPENYSWEALKCNYSSPLPRITSLNLSSSSLTGIIAPSIAKLLLLESLDLSNNNLIGAVPGFLDELVSLKFLNLKGNQLSGSVSPALMRKSEDGLLELRVDDHNICSTCKKKKKNIVVPVVASILSTLVVALMVFLILKLRKKSGTFISNKKGRLAPKKSQFTYAEILAITNNFQTMIGKGGYGSVYHGCMEDGTLVAVKMLSPTSSQGFKEFQAEAELLMRIHHKNLVTFIGYCDETDDLALIYEYMANGNLRNCLSETNPHTLNWEMRLQIAIDAAQGLEYLHHGCKPPIVHRDVKSANILLSENLDAKIADFGLSKVFLTDNPADMETAVVGTTGYLDPEYYITHKLSDKSDVYSFGIVILELITGKRAIIKSDEPTHIIHWISPEIKEGNLNSIIDQRLQGEYDVNSVWKALKVAMACTTPAAVTRATMTFVLTELKECLEMELSRGRERTTKAEEIYNIPPYILYSTDTESMTGPSAR